MADVEKGKAAQASAKKGRNSSVFHRHAPPPVGPKDLRSVMPQIVACLVAGLFNIPEGLALAYSSSLIPRLMQEDGDPDIHITLEQGVLIASVMVVAMCMGTFLTGLVMNRFGRLNTIRYSSVPFAVGWFLVAAASSYEEILIGRILTGIANPLGVNSAVAFNTEVANPHIRGALNSAMTVLASAGMVIMYVLGATMHWRTAAWVCGASPFIGVALMYFFCYESPIWLVSKGRHEEAGRSLRAYARANPTMELREKLPEQQLEWLIQKKEFAEAQAAGKEPWYATVLDLFRTPTGYKPLLLLTAVFLAQNFSGVYITLFYATTFFQEMGVTFSAFQAAIFIGLTRLVIGILTIGLIRGVGIRKLMVGSSFGMAVCMVLSGYFTLYKEKAMDGYVPAGFVLLYVAFSCCGLLTVPWTMTAELFPDRLRDVGQSFTIFIADMLMFAGLQLYPTLMNVLAYGEIKGAVGIQWFFAVVALANVVLVIFFLPETHGKSLSELEEHYEHNMLWLGRTKPDKLTDACVVVPTICATVDAEGVTVLSTVLGVPGEPDSRTAAAGTDSRKASNESILSTGDSYRL